MSKLREMIDTPALIYGHDELGVNECYGPEADDACPRVAVGQPVKCAGRWLRARGWNFKVGADSRRCPLATLGVVRLPRAMARARGGGKR